MSDYAFSDAERWAVFTVQGDACYMCRRPLDLFTMEIDHVLPESLLRYPDVLDAHKTNLGLPANFGINSFENWLPICNGCNKLKSARVFEPSLLIQGQLARAKEKAPRTRAVAAEVPTQRQTARALAVLMRGLSGKPEEQELLLPLIQKFAEMHPEALADAKPARKSRDFGAKWLKRSPTISFGRAPSVFRLSPAVTATFVAEGVEITFDSSLGGVTTFHQID